MTIVIKATHISEGGGLTHLNKMIEWFGKLAPHLQFILIGKNGQEKMFVEAPLNFEYQFYRMPSFNLACRLWWERFRFHKLIEKYLPDLLFEPGNVGTPNATCPRVSLIHNIAPFDSDYISGESFYQKWRQRTLRKVSLKNFQSSAGIILLSEYCQKFFSPYLDRQKSMTKVIYHGGAETGSDNNGRASLNELGIPEEYLLSVSHVWRYKKLEELVKGYLLAVAKNPQLPDLVHAGTGYDKAYLNGILKIVRKSSYPQKVKFLGNVDAIRLRALYQNCRAFLFSSVLETCSVILIEALSLGCAMACSNRSVVPEICGQAAIYFDPYQPEDIARQILKLCEDDVLNDSLRNLARKQSRKYSWEKSASETLVFLEQVMAQHRSSKE